ncbi:MAG: efflux RND transporter periplasmic adaptor subunit [Candidatus Kuenenbacteria bacterium]
MKKIVFIVIGVVIIGGIVLAVVNKGKNESEFVTAFADTGQVVQNVDATGAVSSAEDIELNFRIAGRIESLSAVEGDHIMAGQILAVLEAGALRSQVKDAESALVEAQANLEKLLAGSTAEDVRISEITVEQKKQDLTTKKNDLKSLVSKSIIELKNLKNAAVVDSHNELVVAETAMEIVDNTLDNKDAQSTLGVLDSMSLPRAKDSHDLANESIDGAKLLIADIDENSAESEVAAAIGIVQNTLSDARACLSDVFYVLQNTITSSDLSQSELDAFVSSIQGEQVKISTAKTSLQTAESSWTNKQVYYDEQILKSEDAEMSAKDSLDLAQAQLTFKKAGPQGYEVAAAQAKISKAEANLILAQSKLSDAIIRAPVDGTVVKINYKKGEQTSLASPIIEMIGKISLEIEVDIAESDIVKIRVGQKANVTLDSFGDEKVFKSSVVFIDPAETLISDVVYYEVKVQFDNEVEGIKPGMTANVTIETEKRENVLRVPLRAINQKNGGRIANILNSQNQQEERIVEVGLRGDDYYEIINGIKEGDEVITFVKNK